MVQKIDAASKKAVLGRKMPGGLLQLVVFGIAAALPIAVAQSGTGSSVPSPAAQQKTFATPQQAAEALVQAAGTYDLPALEKILGPGSENLLSSEDQVRDKNAAAEFAAKGTEKTE